MSSKECSDRLVIHASGGTPRVSASTTLLSSSLAFAQDRDGWPSSFTVGTASQGGTYFAYGSGWANFIAEQTGVSGGAEVTGGPVQNMALVHTGDLAFGFTTMGPARDAIEGKMIEQSVVRGNYVYDYTIAQQGGEKRRRTGADSAKKRCHPIPVGSHCLGR